MSNQKANQKVVLIEMANKLQTFNLPHEHYCKALGACSCSMNEAKVTDHAPRTGKPVIKSVMMRVPKVLTVYPRTRTEPLPAAILQCPEVKSALNTNPRELRRLK